ncbi:hypothetical protein [Saccharospirillum salsuginis]|uniref:DUF4440 domain-containing protein n=1 Tax=Saccharospirillum salsuginis TaxID=418750 RepID=A0A918NJH1_9GAMM|nr:hypothetical protein [Saccharospirillum salsuginis]GGX72354.1 hypothetical protein GCM10007392_44750 [Saccharospirillum salsuginis]
MKNRMIKPVTFIVLWLAALCVQAAGLEALQGDWEIAPEASLIAIAEREGLSEAELNDNRARLLSRFESQKPTLSIDDQRIGLVIGNKSIIMDYHVTQATDYSIDLELTLDGQKLPGRIDLFGPQWIRLATGGDNDWYVWRRASGGESALDDRFVQPPSGDDSDESLEGTFKRLARLAERGNFAAIEVLHSDTSRSRNDTEKIANRWNQLSSGLSADDLQVRDVSVMAQHPGVWFVEGRYRRGKQSGPIFSVYFKEIDGDWHVVSMPDLE